MLKTNQTFSKFQLPETFSTFSYFGDLRQSVNLPTFSNFFANSSSYKLKQIFFVTFQLSILTLILLKVCLVFVPNPKRARKQFASNFPRFFAWSSHFGIINISRRVFHQLSIILKVTDSNLENSQKSLRIFWGSASHFCSLGNELCAWLN